MSMRSKAEDFEVESPSANNRLRYDKIYVSDDSDDDIRRNEGIHSLKNEKNPNNVRRIYNPTNKNKNIRGQPLKTLNNSSFNNPLFIPKGTKLNVESKSKENEKPISKNVNKVISTTNTDVTKNPPQSTLEKSPKIFLPEPVVKSKFHGDDIKRNVKVENQAHSFVYKYDESENESDNNLDDESLDDENSYNDMEDDSSNNSESTDGLSTENNVYRRRRHDAKISTRSSHEKSFEDLLEYKHHNIIESSCIDKVSDLNDTMISLNESVLSKKLKEYSNNTGTIRKSGRYDEEDEDREETKISSPRFLDNYNNQPLSMQYFDDNTNASNTEMSEIDQKTPTTVFLSKHFVPVKAKQPLNKLSFVLTAHPRGSRTPHVQCTLIRDRSNVLLHGKLYPTYKLILDENKALLITAQKMKLNRTSNYHLFDNTRGLVSKKLSKKNGNYLGKLRSKNSQRTEYVLLNQSMKKEEVAGICFDKLSFFTQLKDGNQPRKLRVILPPIDLNLKTVPNHVNKDGSGSILNMFFMSSMNNENKNNNLVVEDYLNDNNDCNQNDYSKNVEINFNNIDNKKDCKYINNLNEENANNNNNNNKLKMLKLESKDPTFDKGNYRLNFNGRVSKPSVKNFQLIASEENSDDIICQFGKIDEDIYHLDFKSPLNAFQAFALALCQFNL